MQRYYLKTLRITRLMGNATLGLNRLYPETKCTTRP